MHADACRCLDRLIGRERNQLLSIEPQSHPHAGFGVVNETSLMRRSPMRSRFILCFLLAVTNSGYCAHEGTIPLAAQALTVVLSVRS